MKIVGLEITDIGPVKHFAIHDLKEIVVMGGPNGVGKTTIIKSIIGAFRQPTQTKNVRLIVEATSAEESNKWGKTRLDTSNPKDGIHLQQTLEQPRQVTKWMSSLVHFESDRTIVKIEPIKFTWDNPDPWEETIKHDEIFKGLKLRHIDTLQKIFKKLQHENNKIAQTALKKKRDGEQTMPLNFEDPIEPFRIAFANLLGPKELVDIDAKTQQFHVNVDGKKIPASSLSSGEQEVMNIVFDILLRKPQDSILIFDEPELHLHPELSFRLIQSLRTIGARNQFIFSTHSSDIISSSLDQSVVFVCPPNCDMTNQAIVVEQGDDTYHALKLLGQSIGVISLAKKIVLIEGADSSTDKQLYASILRGKYPEFVLVPAGDKANIAAFSKSVDSVLNKTLWGVDFYMICDRDAAPDASGMNALASKAGGKLAILPRYHIENYLLDEHVYAQAFTSMEQDESWLRSPAMIRRVMRECAQSVMPYSASLIVAKSIRDQVGNIDILPSGCHAKPLCQLVPLFKTAVDAESLRVSNLMDWTILESTIRNTYDDLAAKLESDDDEWKALIPGKQVFNMFAAKTKTPPSRLKNLYITTALSMGDRNPFQDIVSIFEKFRSS